MKAINEFINPENQANLPEFIAYGPVNQKAFETGKISPEQAKDINSAPANAKVQLVLDASFYVGRYDGLQERFDEMIQE